MSSHSIGWTASGTINPSVFVTISGEHTVQQSNYGDQPIGISTCATRDAPIPNALTVAAQSGDSIGIHEDGEYCYLTVGNVAVTAGQNLGPDSNGYGQPIEEGSGGTLPVGAVATENGTPGQSIWVKVRVQRAA
jgi:hypothetical protein